MKDEAGAAFLRRLDFALEDGSRWSLRFAPLQGEDGAFRVLLFRAGEEEAEPAAQWERLWVRPGAEAGEILVWPEGAPGEARPRRLWLRRRGARLLLGGEGLASSASLASEAEQQEAEGASGAASDGVLRAPMTGKVVAVRAAAGARVAEGDCVVVLEAMKMEYKLCAPFDGVVAELRCAEGDQVDLGQALVRVEPASDS